MRTSAALVTAVFLLVSGGAASAFTITSATPTGTTFEVNFDGNVDGNAVDGLSAKAIFELTSSLGQTTTFEITLMNTSGGDITASAVTGLAFNTDPALTGASATGDFDIAIVSGSGPGQTKYPNGFGAVDVCFKTGSQNNNCSGNQLGPELGETAIFSVALNFASDPTSLTVDNAGVRYQRIDGVGFDGDSGTGRGTNGGASPTPEPSAALVFAAGLLVARGVARRRNR